MAARGRIGLFSTFLSIAPPAEARPGWVKRWMNAGEVNDTQIMADLPHYGDWDGIGAKASKIANDYTSCISAVCIDAGEGW